VQGGTRRSERGEIKHFKKGAMTHDEQPEAHELKGKKRTISGGPKNTAGGRGPRGSKEL